MSEDKKQLPRWIELDADNPRKQVWICPEYLMEDTKGMTDEEGGACFMQGILLARQIANDIGSKE